MIRWPLPLVLVLAACSDPWSPPPGAEPFDPPEIFREFWAEVESCSDLTGDFDRVTWFALPQHDLMVEGDSVGGIWRPPHSIYIADHLVEPPYARIIRHEVLHDLTAGPNHTRQEWTFCREIIAWWH